MNRGFGVSDYDQLHAGGRRRPARKRLAQTGLRKRSALLLALSLALVFGAFLPLAALASHDAPTLPLSSPLVDHPGLTLDCRDGDDISGVGTTLGDESTIPPDRDVSGSDNRIRPGTIEPDAVWANATNYPGITALSIQGDDLVIHGRLVSRSHLNMSGNRNQLQHHTEYGLRSQSGEEAFNMSGADNCFSGPDSDGAGLLYEAGEPAQVPRPTPTQPDGFPADFDFDNDGNFADSFEPGSAAATAAAASSQFFFCLATGTPAGSNIPSPLTCDTSVGKLSGSVQGTEMPTGLYYAAGDVDIAASDLEATVTVVSVGKMTISGSDESNFVGYTAGLLFMSEFGEPNSVVGDDALKVSGSTSEFEEGHIFAPNGRVELSGSRNSYQCTVMGDRVTLAGALQFINGVICADEPPPPPDLTPVKANNVNGSTTVGNTWNWTVTISNPGGGIAMFDSGDTIFTDNLPNGTISYSAFTGPTDQTGITGTIACSLVGLSIGCTASGGSVTIGAGGSFKVQVTATPSAPGTFTNPNGICRVDPDNNVQEGNEGNNDCSDTVIVVGPDLTPTKTNNVNGNTVVGEPWIWSITVNNPGGGTAIFQMGETILTDNLPDSGVAYSSFTGPTDASGISGTGTISCGLATLTITCSASGGTVIIGSGGTFKVSVTATPSAADTYANPDGICRVDPGFNVPESNENNNECSNTVIVTAPDLTPTKTNNVGGSTVLGDPWIWKVAVSNNGNGAAIFQTGETILTDNLPNTGVTYSDFSGPNAGSGISGTGTISCGLTVLAISCTASGGTVIIGLGGSFDVQVTATPTATGTYTNPDGICRVDPGFNVPESNENNNDCSNAVTVTGPDLTPNKTNNVGGSVVVGNSWIWKVAVSNNGTGAATFQSGETILTDNLPNTNISYGSFSGPNAQTGISGTGTISCGLAVPTITCTASGGTVVIGVSGGFEVQVTATPSATGTFTNPDGICRVDPGFNVPETNENNNNCSNAVTVTKASPTIVTTPSAGGVVGVVELNDSAVLSGGFNPTGTITFRLFAPSDATCTGTAAFTNVVNVTGNGTYNTSAGFTANAVGVWHWTATYSGDDNNNQALSLCADEPVTVTKASPTIVTTPSAGGVVGVVELNDSAVLSGGFNPTGTITFRLFAPSDATCTGTAAFTNVVNVTGNGTYNTSAGFTANAVGVWHWTATYSGDDNNNQALSLCADEPVTVTKASPTIVTTPSAGGVVGVVELNDSAVLSGGFNPTGTITFRLFAPSDATCTGTAAFTNVVNVTGNGTYNTSAGFTANAVGVWHWTATYSGDDNNNQALSLCADEPVTVIKASPTIVTTPNPASGEVGVTLNDSAILSSGFNPTGTITFRLFAPSDPTCTGTAAFTNVVTVTGNGNYQTSAGFIANVAGTWHWTAAYSGDDNNNEALSPCAAEPVSISSGALWLIIDEDSIDNGIRFHTSPTIGQQNIFPETQTQFSDVDVNDQIARYGQRAVLQYWAQNVDKVIALMTGQTGDEGWFAPNCVPLKWISGNSNNCAEPGSAQFNQGLANFMAGTVPQNRLDNIKDVRPLRARGIEMLEGQTVCAVVYDSDISINYRNSAPHQIGNLQGATLGIVAFTVLDNGVNKMNRFSSSTLPEAQIRIESAAEFCGGPFELFGAPIPRSSSVPNDIDPHSTADDGGYRDPLPPAPPVP